MKLRLPLALALSILGVLALSVSASAATSRLAYVANYRSNTVSVIDTSTMEEVGEPIPVGEMPCALAVSPDGKRVYVASEVTDDLLVIDTATDKVIGTPIELGFEAGEIAIAPDGSKAFVSSENEGLIDVINLKEGEVTDEFEASGEDLWGVALTPNGTQLWVAEAGGNSVSVFGATDSEDRIGEPIEVGESPVNIVFTPDGKTAYVDNEESNTVSVIDVASRQVVATIPVDQSPWGLALTPDGSKLYVSSLGDSTVTVIDTATRQPIGEPIEVGDDPYEIAITPNGKRALVATYGGEEAVVIETATDQVADDSTDLEDAGPWLAVVAPDKSPSAGFNASTVNAGTPTQFTTANVDDPDGFIVRYDWSFGDGATASTTVPQTSHVYAAGGTYTAGLNAIDDEGCGSAQLWTGRGGYCTGSAPVIGQVPVGPAPPKPVVPSNRLRFGKLMLNKKKGTATLQVVLPAAGKLALSGKKVRAVNRKGGPGKLTLAVRPKVKTLKVLKKKGRAKVKVKVTFTPTGGTPGSASRSLTLVRTG